MKIKQYKVAQATDPEQLAAKVNVDIRAQGWQPIGHVVVTPIQHEKPAPFLYCQTMVQYE